MATQTPLSSTTSYLPVAEFLKRYDVRTIADLVSDTGAAVDVTTLSSNANLAAALLDASGDLEAAAMHGAMYTPADLAAIAAATQVVNNVTVDRTTASQGRLFRIVARLALGYLYERRPALGDPPATVGEALKELEQLRSGEMIFGTVETAAAMIQHHEVERPDQVEARNGTTYQAARFFGRRTNRSADF